MHTARSITPKEMRDINRTCVLEYLRENGAVSRSAIAQDLGLSLSSVVRITDDLTKDRLVHLQGEYEYSGGRRRPLIELHSAQNVVVSVSLDDKLATASLCCIDGTILQSHSVRGHQLRGSECIDIIRHLADMMLAQAQGYTVRGISVSVPGIVLNGNRVIAAPAIEMEDFPLADALIPHFSHPVFVENDVNLAALGELWYGAGKQLDDLVYIHVGTFIGMGVVQNRCVLRGAHAGAGELGYVLLDSGDLTRSFAHHGALEERISGYGLSRRAQAVLRHQGAPDGDFAALDLFNRAAAGDAWAAELVDDFVRRLSMALVNVATLFDPEIIILGGGVMESAHPYLPQVHEMIRDKTPQPIRLERSSLGRSANILGGCSSVLQHVMHYTVITRPIGG